MSQSTLLGADVWVDFRSAPHRSRPKNLLSRVNEVTERDDGTVLFQTIDGRMIMDTSTQPVHSPADRA